MVRIRDVAWKQLEVTREHVLQTTGEHVSIAGLVHRAIHQYASGSKREVVPGASVLREAATSGTMKARLEDLARGDTELGKLAKAAQRAGRDSEEATAYDEAAEVWRAKFTPFCEELGLDEEKEGMNKVREMQTKLASRTAAL